MSRLTDVCVVVPTYNERENIERLVPELLDLPSGLSVVVVDDSSPDGTGDAVAALESRMDRVALVRRPAPEGIGPAYKAGFAYALAHGARYIVQMDADFSHPIDKVPELLESMNESDLAVGSRYLRGIAVVNWPIERLLLSYFGNWYARRITGLPVSDVTGGFKCWRRETLEAIRLDRVRSNGYAFQIETTYRAWRLGSRIKEIPIIFIDRTAGDSKMSKSIAFQAMWIVWWLRWESLRGTL